MPIVPPEPLVVSRHRRCLAVVDDAALVEDVEPVGEVERQRKVLLDRNIVTSSLAFDSASATSATIWGASPSLGSSTSSRSLSPTSPRAMASICCWPPDSVPASCPRRSSRIGNDRRRCRPSLTSSGSGIAARGSPRPQFGEQPSPLGDDADAPDRDLVCFQPDQRLVAVRDRPSTGRRQPQIVRSVVVLPAPFGRRARRPRPRRRRGQRRRGCGCRRSTCGRRRVRAGSRRPHLRVRFGPRRSRIVA